MVTIEALPRPTASSVRAEGDLGGRALETVPALPSWPHADVLSSSVVQVMVDAKGFVLSPTLVAASGLKEADLKAIEAAKQVRFQPVPSARVLGAGPRGELAWGRLVFDWHTLPPGATNVSNLPRNS
jgi:hypothetical protein